MKEHLLDMCPKMEGSCETCHKKILRCELQTHVCKRAGTALSNQNSKNETTITRQASKEQGSERKIEKKKSEKAAESSIEAAAENPKVVAGDKLIATRSMEAQQPVYKIVF